MPAVAWAVWEAWEATAAVPAAPVVEVVEQAAAVEAAAAGDSLPLVEAFPYVSYLFIESPKSSQHHRSLLPVVRPSLRTRPSFSWKRMGASGVDRNLPFRPLGDPLEPHQMALVL